MYNTQKISFERKQCIVKSCNRKNTRKFSLPSDTEGAKLWLELLDRKDLTNHRNTSNLRVCEAHFAPHMMTASGKRLVQWAIPYKVTENEIVSASEDVTSSEGQNVNEMTTSTKTMTTTGTTIVVPAIIKANKQKKVEIKKLCEKITATAATTAITATTSATAAASVASTVTVKTTPPITTNTINSIKPQIINLNQVTMNTNEFIKNNGNNRNHQQRRRQNVAEVLNFEIKDDVKSVIEKATTTIIKNDIDLHKNGMQTVIETLKVDTPQIITINPATISTKAIQTIPTIQNNKSTIATTTAATTMPIITTPLKTTPKTLVITEQNLNSVTATSAPTTKKRKLIIHGHNKNKIRKSDLINLAQQAINEAKNCPAKDEDQFDLIGKRIAIDLRHMDQRQKAIAEKLVNDVIYYGKIGQLRETSSFNPFYSSAPTPVVSTASTVIQTAVQSSSSQHQPQQQQQQQQHNNNHQQPHQNHQSSQQTQHQTRQIQTATVAAPIVAGSTSSQTIAIPPVGSLITATPIVSTVQVAGTNQIIYTVSNQNANASTITLNGQTEQSANNGTSGQNDKCQWWPARNIAYM